MKSAINIALVGNPNSGKSTLFNSLTGSHQRVGNWPCSTVERKQGHFDLDKYHIHLIDLPGAYSLAVGDDDSNTALDESITRDCIASGDIDGIINVVDACLLERHLYITLQLLEIGCPMIVVVNRMDLAKQQGVKLDIKALSAQLGCPVIATVAKRGMGLNKLKAALLAQLQATAETDDGGVALRKPTNLPLGSRASVIENAGVYYQKIEHLLKHVIDTSRQRLSATAAIDTILLNRFLGIPFFLLAMYLLFVLSIDVGGIFQDFFNRGSTALFVDGVASGLHALHCPAWIIALLANGAGCGISTVITFIPVLGILFFCLAWLEESGYMARAAFVMDRAMQIVGLPGKSFVPMLIGFGCNVPAVMAARALESPRERIVTIMMAPFMSCGARLAIYAVFTAAFFPVHGAGIIFLLYLIGMVAAVVTGFALRKTLLPGKSHPMVLELPRYQWPNLSAVSKQAWRRLKGFVVRAGKLIIPVCLVVGVLNSVPMPATFAAAHHASMPSLLAYIGQLVTPLLAPMGIHADNWPAAVGLLTGILAKEVMIGSLNTLYSYTAYGQMMHAFDGHVGAFAYLLFVLLYFPCISTTAVMTRELGRGWASFSMLWSTGLAYAIAVLFYQLSTVLAHPLSSLVWVVGVFFCMACVLVAMQRYARRSIDSRSPPKVKATVAGCGMGVRCKGCRLEF